MRPSKAKAMSAAVCRELSILNSQFSILNYQLPLVPQHIHVTVGFECHALLLQQCPLSLPSRSRTPHFVHHPMARQFVGSRCISQGASHHSRMTRPSRQQCDMSVRRHPATRNLAHDVQHILTKPPRLLGRHLIGIVLHSHWSRECPVGAK